MSDSEIAYNITNVPEIGDCAKNAFLTLVSSPPHATHHVTIAQMTENTGQELNLSLDDTLSRFHSIFERCLVDYSDRQSLSPNELLCWEAVLLQFTEYTPDFEQFISFEYPAIDEIYRNIIEYSRSAERPVTVFEQFKIASNLTGGDLYEAMSLLFITSRQYARWLDSPIIHGLPNFTEEEIIEQMIKWKKSMCAFKNTDPQDVPGDTYYFWTHALAKVIHQTKANDVNPARVKFADTLFENGTWLMHNIIHRLNDQGIVNSHLTAAEYGNKVGDLISYYVNAS